MSGLEHEWEAGRSKGKPGRVCKHCKLFRGLGDDRKSSCPGPKPPTQEELVAAVLALGDYGCGIEVRATARAAAWKVYERLVEAREFGKRKTQK